VAVLQWNTQPEDAAWDTQPRMRVGRASLSAGGQCRLSRADGPSVEALHILTPAANSLTLTLLCQGQRGAQRGAATGSHVGESGGRSGSGESLSAQPCPLL